MVLQPAEVNAVNLDMDQVHLGDTEVIPALQATAVPIGLEAALLRLEVIGLAVGI